MYQQKLKTIFIIMFLVVYNHLELRIVACSLLEKESGGSWSTMLHRHVCTVAKNGQNTLTRDRGFQVCCSLSSHLYRGD